MPTATVPSTYFVYKPRSIEEREFWQAITKEPRFATLLESIAYTVEYAPARPPTLLATDYMAAHRSNDRGRTDVQWQQHRKELSHLIVHRLMRGIEPDDSDDRLLDWLWELTNEPSWTVAAHTPGLQMPLLELPVLDLASTEFAAFLAETVEVLRPWMDRVAKNLADSILFEIDRRVLTPFVTQPPAWWAQLDCPHPNNWTGVCAGSILAACRSLAAQGRPRPQAEAQAIDLLNMFWARSFTPDGECDEGVGYWVYGVAFAVYGMSRLSADEYSTRFDTARVARIAAYPRRAHLVGTAFYTGNDSSMRTSNPRYCTPWLAAATGESWLLDWPTDPIAAPIQTPEGKRQLPTDPGAGHLRHVGLLLRVLCTPADRAARPRDLPGDLMPALLIDQQAGMLRTISSRGPIIATLAGGTNAESHNHNDLGHFLVVLNGQLRVIDLGSPHYTADIFGPKRYEYMSCRSLGHNVPVINGVEQIAGRAAAGKILSWNPSGDAPSLALDLTAAYPADAKLASWTRTLRRRPNDANLPFAIDDTFRTTEPGVSIAHAFWTIDRPQFVAADRIKLGDDLAIHLTRPMAIGFEEFPAASMLLREFVGQTLYRIEARYETDSAGALSLQTLIAVE